MTNSDTNPIDALSELLEERRRYEGWLAQLEERRAETPAHVVDRVRSDYQSRLDGVTQQLRGRASDLEGSAAGLREQIANLLQEETGRRDERFELELRASVGEFEPDRARDAMSACDEAIARLANERGGFEAELSRITEVLALVAPPPEPDVSPMEAPDGDESSSDRSAVAVSDEEREEGDHGLDESRDDDRSALSTSSLRPSESSPMDELAFLHSVVDTPRSGSPREGSVREGSLRESPGREGGAREESVRAQDGARESSTTRGEDGADLLPPPVLTAPRRPVTPLSSSITSNRDRVGDGQNSPSLTPGSIPSFLKDMPTEQVKTLKCQECGTMNYPTEWYCERCGGELAAM